MNPVRNLAAFARDILAAILLRPCQPFDDALYYEGDDDLDVSCQ